MSEANESNFGTERRSGQLQLVGQIKGKICPLDPRGGGGGGLGGVSLLQWEFCSHKMNKTKVFVYLSEDSGFW